MDCNADSVLVGAYRYRKDKCYRATVETDSVDHMETYKFQETFYDYTRSQKVRTDWMVRELEIIQHRADTSKTNTLLYINLGMNEYIPEHHRRSFDGMVQAIKPVFQGRYQETHFTTSNLYFRAFSNYSALNSPENVNASQVFKNGLMDFNSESFSIIYHVGSSAGDFYQKENIFSYNFSSVPLKMFIITNKCAGQRQIFLRFLESIIERKETKVFTSPCIPTYFNVSSDHLKTFDLENQCLDISASGFIF